MYRLCHIAHKGFDVGHSGGAVLGKELDDGTADDGTIADFNALNRESQWVEEKNLNFSAVLHPGAKMPIMNTEAKPRGAVCEGKDKRRTPMPGILYIVATPIGNLDDMPPRVAATFGAADFVAAEDTRVTLKLLNHLGLKKPMMSYYEHALHHGAAILDRIEAGESCALCSDAGMPCISDPGEQIVKDAIARGITVTPVPGASACVTALAVSGQDTARFVFEGFLPVPKKERRERLEFLQGETRTVIFYEAPHKLRGTLDDLCAAFGAERSITLCRELTKLHEEITKTTIGEAVRYYEQNDPRGEYVLVMAGAPAAQAAAEEVTLPDAVATARLLMTQGPPPAAAAKQAAKGTPFSKGDIYKELIAAKDEDDREEESE